jgi:hypothetical protein
MWPRPLLRVALYIPGISQQWATVQFLLDTGASTSCVHPLDATTELGIDPAVLSNPSLWMRQRTSHGIGGSSTDYVVQAQYALRRDDSCR